MIEVGSVITLDNDKKYTVLRLMDYNDKKYALITDMKKENYVVLIENDESGSSISLIENPKEEEFIINKFLSDTLKDLKKMGIN